MNTIYRHVFDVVMTALLAVTVVGCATTDDLKRGEPGGKTKLYESAYEDVYQSTIEALEEVNFKIERQDSQKGEIFGQRQFMGGMTECFFGNYVAVFLERVNVNQTKAEFQEVVRTGCGGVQYLSEIQSNVTRKIKDKLLLEAKIQRDVPGPSEVAPAPSDVDEPARLGHVASNKHAYAVVIGIERYREKLPQADFAAHDAKIVGDYLMKVLGFPQENIIIRLNDNATRTDFEKYIEGWLPNHVEKDAFVFVYFSGHGAPNVKTGDAYLVPYDGDPSFVEKTGYSVKRLYENLGKLPAKEIVVVLDSCFSGAGGRSVIAQGMRPMGLAVEQPVSVSGKTVVLAASAGDQVSSTYRQKSHGLLTYFFLKGLQGDADQNKDGAIELAELYEYIKPQVSRVARREFNNDQTPQLIGNAEMIKRGMKLVEPPAR